MHGLNKLGALQGRQAPTSRNPCALQVPGAGFRPAQHGLSRRGSQPGLAHIVARLLFIPEHLLLNVRAFSYPFTAHYSKFSEKRHVYTIEQAKGLINKLSVCMPFDPKQIFEFPSPLFVFTEKVRTPLGVLVVQWQSILAANYRHLVQAALDDLATPAASLRQPKSGLHWREPRSTR